MMNDRDGLLTCPVCLEIESPTFQCLNGHIVCGPCLDRLSVQPERHRVCPTCRVKLGKGRIRCLIAEAMIESRANEAVAVASSQPLIIDAAGADSKGGRQVVRVLRRAERVARVYQIVNDNPVEIRAGPSTSSKRKENRSLPFGSYVQIVEMMTIEDIVGHKDTGSNGSGSGSGSGSGNGNGNGQPQQQCQQNRQQSKKDQPARRGLIRGRLDASFCEGWITLAEAGSAGRTYALHVEPGTYQIVAPTVTVTSSVNLDSGRLEGSDGTIHVDDCVDVVALRHLPSRGDRVRGRLATGGWITIFDGQNGRQLARQFRKGVYATVAKSTEVTDGVRRKTVGKSRLEAGRCINIVNTVYSPEDGCVRGQLASNGGWVSLLDKTDWRIHIQNLPLGAYQMQQSRKLYKSPGYSSGSLKRTLPGGCYVEIVQMIFIEREDMVWGRLCLGGWVNLLDKASGVVYATPVPTGVYVTTHDSSVVDSRAYAPDSADVECKRPGMGGALSTNGSLAALPSSFFSSQSPSQPTHRVKTLDQFSTVEVTECRYLQRDRCVRAHLCIGGWMTLVSSEGGSAKPIMVGPYTIICAYMVVHRGIRLEKAAEVKRIPINTVVDVVETCYVDRDGHIRGRLATGGWISLVDVQSNIRYARKVVQRRSTLSAAATSSAADGARGNDSGCNNGNHGLNSKGVGGGPYAHTDCGSSTRSMSM